MNCTEEHAVKCTRSGQPILFKEPFFISILFNLVNINRHAFGLSGKFSNFPIQISVINLMYHYIVSRITAILGGSLE